MKSVTFSTSAREPTYVFYTDPSVKVFRQLGFVADEVKRYVVVPAMPEGYCIISLVDGHFETLGIKRFVLHRPAAIEIELRWGDTVEFEVLHPGEAKKAAEQQGSDWAHIYPGEKGHSVCRFDNKPKS